MPNCRNEQVGHYWCSVQVQVVINQQQQHGHEYGDTKPDHSAVTIPSLQKEKSL